MPKKSVNRGPSARALLGICAIVTALTGGEVRASRLFAIEDALNAQDIRSVATSPSSDLVAVSITRKLRIGDNYRWPDDFVGIWVSSFSPRNDIVVLSADGQRLFGDTGISDGSSSFAPQWSPDGKTLAYLHVTRSGAISLVVWSAQTRVRRVVVASGVKPFLTVIKGPQAERRDRTSIYSSAFHEPFRWIGSDRILFIASGQGLYDGPGSSRRRIALAATGRFSGAVWRTSEIPACGSGNKLIIAKTDGSSVTVASGHVIGASVSPDANRIIVVSAIEPLAPPASLPIRSPYQYAGESTDVPISRWQAQVYALREGTWIKTGTVVDGQGRIYQYALPNWTLDGKRWASVSIDDPFAKTSGATFTIISANVPNMITTHFADRVRALDELNNLGQNSAKNGGPTAFQEVSPKLLAKLGDDVTQIGITRSAGEIVSASHSGVLALYAVSPRRTVKLLELNSEFAEIPVLHGLAVRYSSNGGVRTGFLFLPTDARRNPPVVVTGYPNNGPRRISDSMDATDNPVFRLLLQNGVAVFKEELQMAEIDRPREDPVDRIVSETNAAVNALKLSHRVDTNRMGFWGHSFGGYTALALLQKTHYFREITASAPLADLVGFELGSTVNRFLDQECGAAQQIAIAASQEDPGSNETLPMYRTGNMFLRLGGPAYDNMKEYLRDSPLYHLEHATTPTLIIDGSEDSFAQGDQVFSVLYRRGIDAELINFWGEEHDLEAPENIREELLQTVKWTLEHLVADRPSTTAH